VKMENEEFSLSTCNFIFHELTKDQRDFIVLVEHLERRCFMCHSPLNLAKCIKGRGNTDIVL
jgi:hypothetical protein